MAENAGNRQTSAAGKAVKAQPEKQEPHTGRKPPAARYAPNIVPLIDVLFMLLLYFLLSTHFRQTEGDIPGTLPALGPGPTRIIDWIDPTPITVLLRPVGQDDTGCVFEIPGVKTAITAPDDLYKYLLSRQKAFGKDVPIIIKPVGGVQWQHVVEAFNQAVRAEFHSIGFGTSI